MNPTSAGFWTETTRGISRLLFTATMATNPRRSGSKRIKVRKIRLSVLSSYASNFLEKFRELCKLEADLSSLCTDKERRTLGGLIDYWLLDFEIELKLGTTEFEARIKWEQNVRVFNLKSFTGLR